jgi:hypothetical protein
MSATGMRYCSTKSYTKLNPKLNPNKSPNPKQVWKRLQQKMVKLEDEIRRLVKEETGKRGAKSPASAGTKSPTGASSHGAHKASPSPMQHISSKKRTSFSTLLSFCHTHGFAEEATATLLKKYDELAVWRERYMKLLRTAFVNRRDSAGNSALHVSPNNRSLFNTSNRSLLKLIRRDSAGNTALHVAVEHRRKSTIDWLLDNGAEASLSFLNNDNLTPLTLAVWHIHVCVCVCVYGGVAYTHKCVCVCVCVCG